MAEDETLVRGSAFCDQIIGTFVAKIRDDEQLAAVADRLEEQILRKNKTSEAALREALFGSAVAS